jgi:protease I
VKKIAVLIENNYQTLEAWYPYYRLREAGMQPIFVGHEKKEYTSKEGYPAKAELAGNELKTMTFDGVIVPGGFAPDKLRQHQELNKLVREIFEQGKLVAAICHGGWVLVSAGILKNKSATSYIGIKDDMVNAGAKYLDQEVVVDNNLITSRKPDDLPAFSHEIIKFLLNGKKQ